METQPTSLVPEEKNKSKAARIIKTAKHGVRYEERAKLVDKNKIYSPAEAIGLLKKTSYAKFDASVQAHFRLGIDPAKNEQQVRLAIALPNGTGKEIKVLLFSREAVKSADILADEAMVGKIETGQVKPGRDFQAVVATPEFMPKIARLGKILGPKGLMPNPRAGTVSNDPAKVIDRLKKGQVEMKNEPTAPLIHAAFGKVSFTEEQLLENLKAVVNALKAARPAKTKGEFIQSLSLSSTMGMGIKVDLSSLK